MTRFRFRSQAGSVLLVALCFVTVLGISLAGYIAVCSRTMQLSNRAAQTALSQQLADMGIEEAMRAFNKGDWSDWSNGPAADWTLSGTTATCNLTFPAGTFGQGVTGSVKIRVDNYNANQLNATWSPTTTYRPNDLVGYNGVWYRGLVTNLNQIPTNASSSASATSTFWIEEQMPLNIPWCYPMPYKVEAVVYYSVTGSWYRCILAHTSSATILPTNTAYWTQISVITTNVSTSSSNNESLLHYWSGATWAWWRYNNGWDSVPAVSWRWRGFYPYVVDDVVAYNGIWYRCIAATSSSSSPPANPACWSNAPSNTMWAWSSSSIKYSLSDVVYYSGQWYRCILAHTSGATITPANTSYWANAPRFTTAWASTKQYSRYDSVRYNGVWYLSLLNSNSNQNPATATNYWVGANTSTASYQWNATTAYSAGDYKCYGGVWYKCLSANTGYSPNNITYWTATWTNSWGIATGAPVIYAEGTVNLAGSPSIKTQLRATIAPAPLFPNAAASATTISASSGGTVDSYDSYAGTYASQVNTSTNYSAVVAAADTSGTAVSLSSTAVQGYVAAPSSSSSPYAPLFSSGGSVKGFTSPVSPNIDLTRISRSPYIPKFATLPSGGLATNWATTHKGTALSLSYTTIIGTAGSTTRARYYYNGNLTIGTATLNVLRINGPVILYVNGDLFITASGSTGRIEIANTGSAEIHVAGAFKADAVGEGILSYNTDPKSLIIICDTTGTANHFYSEGVNPLYGVVYIPYSTSSSGFYNDNNSTNIYGAVSASKITYSGANMNIHYDTALRYTTFGGVDQPYSITQWRELTDPNERAVLP